ncbi:Sortase A [Lentibacillus sp. JNUCC-1]|uniref:class D sortase n=1 Tax=Lentibacillus sp. JNUCC-1 TaxID=2654513 RepID=UPI0012E8DB58|nr:class D sortase [Lentibacillus sp. JNUCC-1]MUV36801.1 Sortase A [Lentibacillus sp. JNUCC-1]
MKLFSQLLIVAGLILIAVFGYQYMEHEKAQKQSLEQAEKTIEQYAKKAEQPIGDSLFDPYDFEAEDGTAFATLEIPKLGKTLPIVEGTDAEALKQGVGHLSNSVYPGQNEQIVLSGHRDTVFRQFDQIEIGDRYTVKTPYGTYTYEIRETEIVPENDTSVIRKMGEEALVVTTCYPFDFVGSAPDRFVTYAYPIKEEDTSQ